MQKSIIVQGTFVNSDSIFSGQVLIENGIITKVGANIGTPTYTFDKEHLIFPGMGDIHIHAREDEGATQNYKEDYTTAQEAAIHGGVVHVAAMPNTPEPLITMDRWDWHRKQVKDKKVTFLNYIGVGPGTKPLDVNAPYKVYTGPSVGPLFFKSEEQLEETLEHYRGKPVSFHVEDYDVLIANADNPTHDTRRPISCVLTALKYVLRLIEKYGLDAKLCHWSCGDESFDLIRQHRERGYNTTIEVSPLHLFFDTDLLKEQPELWPYVQMNPSLQGRKHRLQLIQGLKEGFINFIATDHAPHTLDEKFKNFESEQNYKDMRKSDFSKCKELSCKNGTSGTPQLDTYALIATWLMQAHKFTPQDIARVTAENPGMFANKFHEGKGKFGRVEEGYYGSFTIIAPNQPTTVKRENLKTKVGWSPFENITFPGSIIATIIKGEIVYES